MNQASNDQVDPICGRNVQYARSQVTGEYKSQTYVFCSVRCRHAFEAKAERQRLLELARTGGLLSPGKVRWGIA